MNIIETRTHQKKNAVGQKLTHKRNYVETSNASRLCKVLSIDHVGPEASNEIWKAFEQSKEKKKS